MVKELCSKWVRPDTIVVGNTVNVTGIRCTVISRIGVAVVFMGEYRSDTKYSGTLHGDGPGWSLQYEGSFRKKYDPDAKTTINNARTVVRNGAV
jgi:hypothetical protein